MRFVLALIAALILALPAHAQTWVRTWAAAPEAAKPLDDRNRLPDLTDRTLRHQ